MARSRVRRIRHSARRVVPVTLSGSPMPRSLPVLPPVSVLSSRRAYQVQALRSSGDDARRWHPLQSIRPRKTIHGGSYRARPVIRNVSSPVLFYAPSSATLCVRRSIRREVLFAKRRAGRSGPIRRRSIRNQNSTVRCS